MLLWFSIHRRAIDGATLWIFNPWASLWCCGFFNHRRAIDGEGLQNLVLFQRSPNPAEGFRHARNLDSEDAKQMDFIYIRMLQLLQSVTGGIQVKVDMTRHL